MLEQSGIKKIGVSNIDKFKVGYENWQSKVQKNTKADRSIAHTAVTFESFCPDINLNTSCVTRVGRVNSLVKRPFKGCVSRKYTICNRFSIRVANTVIVW